MGYQLDFSVVTDNIGALMGGAAHTLEIAAISIVFGLILGLLLALLRSLQAKAAKYAVICYVEAIRNTPFIVQLFIVFFVLPLIGIKVDAFPAGIIALSLNCAGYATEIIRAGIESIHESQVEAARSLGMSYFQAFRYAILKPAMITIFPSLSSLFITIMLGSSVLSAISTPELTSVAYTITAYQYRHFEVFTFVAIVYLVMSVLLSAVFKYIEVRFLTLEDRRSLVSIVRDQFRGSRT
jgi:polar amino acid transport system permease protein